MIVSPSWEALTASWMVAKPPEPTSRVWAGPAVYDFDAGQGAVPSDDVTVQPCRWS